MIIDATNMIVGRLGSYVAKKALLGETIDVINCDKAVITGTRVNVLAKYKQNHDRGVGPRGPIIPRMPDRFVRRIIRGMLPYHQEKGRAAFERIMCYSGKPAQFDGKAVFADVPGANVAKTKSLLYVPIKDICKFLGAKIQ